MRRAFVEAVAGRKVRLTSVTASDESPSLDCARRRRAHPGSRRTERGGRDFRRERREGRALSRSIPAGSAARSWGCSRERPRKRKFTSSPALGRGAGSSFPVASSSGWSSRDANRGKHPEGGLRADGSGSGGGARAGWWPTSWQRSEGSTGSDTRRSSAPTGRARRIPLAACVSPGRERASPSTWSPVVGVRAWVSALFPERGFFAEPDSRDAVYELAPAGRRPAHGRGPSPLPRGGFAAYLPQDATREENVSTRRGSWRRRTSGCGTSSCPREAKAYPSRSTSSPRPPTPRA